MTDGGEKSDLAVVAGKLPNKAGKPGAEAMEPRAGAKENAEQRNTRRTQSRESVLQLKSLRRRSQRHNMPWERMNRIIDAWMPPAVIRHPWPNQRFDVKHPRQEPSALAAHARICAGGAA